MKLLYNWCNITRKGWYKVDQSINFSQNNLIFYRFHYTEEALSPRFSHEMIPSLRKERAVIDGCVFINEDRWDPDRPQALFRVEINPPIEDIAECISRFEKRGTFISPTGTIEQSARGGGIFGIIFFDEPFDVWILYF